MQACRCSPQPDLHDRMLPEACADIAEKWSIAPQELVMIGDSAKDDVSLVVGCGLHTVVLCG